MQIFSTISDNVKCCQPGSRQMFISQETAFCENTEPLWCLSWDIWGLFWVLCFKTSIGSFRIVLGPHTSRFCYARQGVSHRF